MRIGDHFASIALVSGAIWSGSTAYGADSSWTSAGLGLVTWVLLGLATKLDKLMRPKPIPDDLLVQIRTNRRRY